MTCVCAHLPNSLPCARRYVECYAPTGPRSVPFREPTDNIRRARRTSDDPIVPELCPRCAHCTDASTVACDLTRRIAFLAQIRVSGRARVRGRVSSPPLSRLSRRASLTTSTPDRRGPRGRGAADGCTCSRARLWTLCSLQLHGMRKQSRSSSAARLRNPYPRA